jgi:hypothetical protein
LSKLVGGGGGGAWGVEPILKTIKVTWFLFYFVSLCVHEQYYEDWMEQALKKHP